MASKQHYTVIYDLFTIQLQFINQFSHRGFSESIYM